MKVWLRYHDGPIKEPTNPEKFLLEAMPRQGERVRRMTEGGEPKDYWVHSVDHLICDGDEPRVMIHLITHPMVVAEAIFEADLD